MAIIPIKKKHEHDLFLTGFILIELLVAIAIIGILSSMAVAAVQYARAQAKIGKATSDINEIYKAMTALSNDIGAWPGNQPVDAVNAGNGNEICGDGCAFGIGDAQAGITASNGSANWSGPYMNEMALDPWSHQYFFDTDYRVTADNLPCNGGGSCVNAAVVGSYGPDGIGNNLYNKDDIIKILIK